MIRELMQRSVVLGAARRVVESLHEAKTEKALREGGNDTDEAAIEDAAHKIDDWEKSEAIALAGGGEDAWIPSDPIAGLVQSVLEDHFFETGLVKEPSVLGAADVPAVITDLRLPTGSLNWLTGSAPQAYEHWDPRWLTQGGIAFLTRALRRKFPFPDVRPPSVPFADRARLILVGDWGSGLDRAQCVATAIRYAIDEGKAHNRQVHVMHLGDVYYTGFSREYDRKFLRFWPVELPDANKVFSWCLNGNHDMYSGGWGYFDHLLKNKRFEAQGQSSCFSLENARWVLLGLDTAYKPADRFGMAGDLSDEQIIWVQEKAKRARARNKRVILFSHHQPFGAYPKTDASKINRRLEGSLSAGHIHGWFWGHEHRCAFYESTENIKYPCLVGHGGVPEIPRTLGKPDGVIFEHTASIETGLFGSSYLQFGFAVLDFDADQIACRFITERAEAQPDNPIMIRA